MNKFISFLLLTLIGTATGTFAMDTGAGVGGTDDRRAREMVAIQMLPETAERGAQTERASLLQEFELVGDRELHADGRCSIGTQAGQPVRIFKGLQEVSIGDLTREALADDQKEKMLAMKKKMKYMGPCYCVLIGASIYFTYFFPR